MADIERVRAALEELAPGDEIRLRLDDGREIEGVLQAVDSAVHLEGANAGPIDPARIEAILIDASSEWPE
jgi:small nuclear ribonucleoprotein (snRNP)-like protein